MSSRQDSTIDGCGRRTGQSSDQKSSWLTLPYESFNSKFTQMEIWFVQSLLLVQLAEIDGATDNEKRAPSKHVYSKSGLFFYLLLSPLVRAMMSLLIINNESLLSPICCDPSFRCPQRLKEVFARYPHKPAA